MIKSLTSLRGIFILFIFFHHCLNLYPGGGSMAVTFFFVLGGFVMTLGYKERVLSPDFGYKKFLTKRLIKFYPLHWLCILVFMPLIAFSFSLKQIPILVLNATLLQTWIPIKGVYFSFNAVSWYLADTIFFTAVFPFIFKWLAGTTPKEGGVVAMMMAIIYVLMVVLIPVEKYHAILYVSPYMRLMDFVFGIYLALGYLKIKDEKVTKWNNKACQIAILALIVLLVIESCLLSENERLFAPIYWIPVALLILITSFSERIVGGANFAKQIITASW